MCLSHLTLNIKFRNQKKWKIVHYEKLRIHPHFSRQGIRPGIGDWHLGVCFTTFVGVFYMTGVRNAPKCWKTANSSWKVAISSDITMTETEIITECQVLLSVKQHIIFCCWSGYHIAKYICIIAIVWYPVKVQSSRKDLDGNIKHRNVNTLHNYREIKKICAESFSLATILSSWVKTVKLARLQILSEWNLSQCKTTGFFLITLLYMLVYFAPMLEDASSER